MQKFYLKKGNKNYKEKRLLKEIEAAFEMKLKSSPNFKFVPASNFDELKQLHTSITSTDVEFEEVEKDLNDNTEPMENKNNNQEIEDEQTVDSGMDDDSTDFTDTDPFNREEPEVRDYVTAEDPQAIGGSKRVDPFARFDEPTSFEEAFHIPDIEDVEIVEEQGGGSNQQNTTNQNTRSRNEPRPQRQESQPVNPDYDSMSNGKKKKQTKKFAKYIVETICMLSEKGFVWYANKDINESKLAEYELNGEMDLDLLVTLDTNQEVTVKQFFQSQCAKAEELSKIDPEQKEDLIDSLTEVLLEKGVAPTPTQELMMVALSVLGGQAVALLSLKSQTTGLLNQLRAMKKEESDYEPVYNTPPPQPTQRQAEAPQPTQAYEEPFFDTQENDAPQYQLESVIEDESFIIDNPIETKE